MLTDGDIDSLSLRKVAKAAGVSPNAPYRHFEDKQALLAAVAERGYAELVDSFSQSRTKPPRERLIGLATAYLEYAKRNPAAYRIMFGKHLHSFEMYPELQSTASLAFYEVLTAVNAIIDLDIEDLSVVRGAMTLWAMVHGLAMLSEDCPVLMTAPERLPTAEMFADLFIQGVGGLKIIPAVPA
jgi:AcrR family transcriptional regulator